MSTGTIETENPTAEEVAFTVLLITRAPTETWEAWDGWPPSLGNNDAKIQAYRDLAGLTS